MMNEQHTLNLNDSAFNGGVSQWLTFRLSNSSYAINVKYLKEVVTLSPIHSIQHSPKYSVGSIALRGNHIHVFDTRLCFGFSRSEFTDKTRILIIEDAQNDVGFLIDTISGVVYLHNHQIDATSNKTGKMIHISTEGTVSNGDELLTLLDLQKLIRINEMTITNG